MKLLEDINWEQMAEVEMNKTTINKPKKKRLSRRTRDFGENPRVKGTNPRAKGTNPRAKKHE